jgi:hypothetical protein
MRVYSVIIMENTMDNDDVAHLIFVIRQWAARPENSWFNTKFVDSMQEKFKLTVKQKKALLNIHSKCLKKEYKGACDMCRGTAGMMYLCEGDYMHCIDCNDKWEEESPVVKEDDLPILLSDQKMKDGAELKLEEYDLPILLLDQKKH